MTSSVLQRSSQRDALLATIAASAGMALRASPRLVRRLPRTAASNPLVINTAGWTVAQVESYWQRSRGPLAALVLVGPILVVHGLLVLGWPSLARPAQAEAYLRWALVQLGFGSAWLLPALVAVVLSAWHLLRPAGWPTWRVAAGMLAESALLAACMWYLAGLCTASLGPATGELMAGAGLRQWADHLGHGPTVWLTGPGRGVYEEVLYRLALLPLVMLVVRRFQCPSRTGWMLGVLATSLLYALGHGPLSLDTLAGWSRMAGRTLAGVWFAWLFQRRGFGIAAGTHAWYELLTAC